MAISDVHIWWGRFDSEARFGSYLEAHYSDGEGGSDERPISRFAAGQGEVFYDEDWIEANFLEEPTRDSVAATVAELVSPFSYASSFLEPVCADAAARPLEGGNAVIGIDVEEISDPRSVTDEGVELLYLGAYQRMPSPPAFDASMTSLSLNDRRLSEVPPEVFGLTRLTELSLAKNSLTVIPERIGELSELEVIYLYDNQLTELPDELFRLPRLRKIHVDGNQIASLSGVVGGAASLRSLSVADNRLSRLPVEIGELVDLEGLYLSRNELTDLPDEIGRLTALEYLDVASNRLLELPAAVGRLGRLRSLRCGGNPIRRLPDEITRLSIPDQLALPQFFDIEAQTPVVRDWWTQRQRGVDERRAARRAARGAAGSPP